MKIQNNIAYSNNIKFGNSVNAGDFLARFNKLKYERAKAHIEGKFIARVKKYCEIATKDNIPEKEFYEHLNELEIAKNRELAQLKLNINA